MKHIIGKRVILFPFEREEIPHFVELHREDKQGFMGKYCLREMTQEEGEKYITALLITGDIRVFSICTKEGKASKKFGYVYLSDISEFSANVVGIIDKSMLRGLAKIIKAGKYSFTEDALKTIVNHCFDNGFQRVEYYSFKDNSLSNNLAKKTGFIKEGVLRKSFYKDGKYHDRVVYSIIKDDIKSEDIDTKKGIEDEQ